MLLSDAFPSVDKAERRYRERQAYEVAQQPPKALLVQIHKLRMWASSGGSAHHSSRMLQRMLYRPPYCCCSTGSTSWNLQCSRGLTGQAQRNISVKRSSRTRHALFTELAKLHAHSWQKAHGC